MTHTATTNEPTLAELLAKSQAETNSLAELEAKQAAEREAAATEAQAAQAAAQAAVDAALAPFRAKRDAIIQGQVEAVAARAEVAGPMVSAFEAKVAKLKEKFEMDYSAAIAPFMEAIDKAEEKLTALEAKVLKETGIPAVLMNADIAPAPKPKTATKKVAGVKSSTRKSPKVSDLGEIAEVMITAPKRYPQLDPTNPVSVQYKVTATEDGTLVLSAKRVDKVVDGVHVISAEAMEGDYTHSSTTASEVTTTPGWHSTKDVMFALLSVAGKTGDWPEYGPDSDSSDVLVNGEPLTTPVAASAVTIQETV